LCVCSRGCKTITRSCTRTSARTTRSSSPLRTRAKAPGRCHQASTWRS
jgi:hypothetical protein